MSQNGIRQFLVVKRWGKLESVNVYDDLDEAHRAYVKAERECGWITAIPGETPAPAECVLLGADRLNTCISTHGNWFDEPNRLIEELEAAPGFDDSDCTGRSY